MEELIKMLPGGAVTITLAVLAAIRVGIGIIDRTIAKTPDKHDDAGWAKIRTSFAFILLEEILFYTAGIKLPQKTTKATPTPQPE